MEYSYNKNFEWWELNKNEKPKYRPNTGIDNCYVYDNQQCIKFTLDCVFEIPLQIAVSLKEVVNKQNQLLEFALINCLNKTDKTQFLCPYRTKFDQITKKISHYEFGLLIVE